MTEIANNEMRHRLGNLTQIRELLFGEQIENYDNRFQKYQKQLEEIESNLQALGSNLAQFKLDQKHRIDQLQNELSGEISTAINSLDKKLQYLSLNTSNEVAKINKNIEARTQKNTQIIDSFAKKFDTQNQNLKAEVHLTRTNLEKDLVSLKQELLQLLEHDLSDLTKNKVSRHELADLLFEVCIKIKGTDVKANSTNDNKEMKAELILPGNSDDYGKEIRDEG